MALQTLSGPLGPEQPPEGGLPGDCVSIVIASYSSERWDDLVGVLASIQRQTVRPLEVIVAVDRNAELLARLRAERPDVIAVPNEQHAGAGGARNSGVAAARGAVLAFLDDDVEVSADWLRTALRALDDEPLALGVGGDAVPAWDSDRPAWFPQEFDWVIGCSFRGMPTRREVVRNLFACNMLVHRDVFEAVGGFRPDYGKVGQRSAPEETDFCIRAAQRFGDRPWLYEPPAAVAHRVPDSRASLRYFLKRCWYEGRGKAELARLVGTDSGLDREREYTRRVLPGAVVTAVAGAVRGGAPRRALPALGIVGGLGAAAFGFAFDALAAKLHREGAGHAGG